MRRRFGRRGRFGGLGLRLLLPALGVALALFGYLALRRHAPPEAPPAPQEAALEKFHFYEMLKRAEVDVGTPEAAWETGRITMLQTGFFARRKNAEARRKRLEALGMEARVAAHASGWRVLLGPFPSRVALQQARERLQLEDIEALRISMPRALSDQDRNASPETDAR